MPDTPFRHDPEIPSLAPMEFDVLCQSETGNHVPNRHPANWAIRHSCGHIEFWCGERFRQYTNPVTGKATTVCPFDGKTVKVMQWIRL